MEKNQKKEKNIGVNVVVTFMTQRKGILRGLFLLQGLVLRTYLKAGLALIVGLTRLRLRKRKEVFKFFYLNNKNKN